MASMSGKVIPTPPDWRKRHPSTPSLANILEYNTLYEESIRSPETFWANQARDLLSFTKNFHTVHTGSLENGENAWFLGGKLNACFNCVDRHAFVNPDRVAIICEPDDPADESQTITYGDLLRQVSQAAGLLRACGVKKGDIVTIYMPMVSETIVSILACARIGAIHSVVFAGFSADALRDRIQDAESKVVITTDEGRRGGKTIQTKYLVDQAVQECPTITNVLVCKRTAGELVLTPGRDLLWGEELKKYSAYLPPVPMDSEDFLFLLYTSGSTGKPKGVLHSTAGYLLGAAVTGKYVFDVNCQDRFFCSGDIGWITGHTYVIYAPLLLGCSTVVFEGTPTYPSPTRFWDIIAKHGCTHFYGAPTALRLLKRSLTKADISGANIMSLRVLGSVGEPISPEIWRWYHDFMGDEQAVITDTYWQTETGSHIIAACAGVTPMKPGSASLPCFGIDLAIIDPVKGEELRGNSVEGVLGIKHPWPSMARTIRGSHDRYMDTYFNVYKGYYFTGDGAYRDHDGHYWIRGRVDDVINVSGHRLSTSEIESVIIEHPSIAEAAIIGVPDELTGQAINAVVSLKTTQDIESIKQQLISKVRSAIGPFAAPRRILVVEDLPKTRSGKIVRRILRKALSGETEFGDISTLANPSVLDNILEAISSA